MPPFRPDASFYYSSILACCVFFDQNNPTVRQTLNCRKVNAPWASHCHESKALSCDELGQVQWLQSGSVGCESVRER